VAFWLSSAKKKIFILKFLLTTAVFYSVRTMKLNRKQTETVILSEKFLKKLHCVIWPKKENKTKLRGFSPQANYTDGVTAAYRRS
jgi:hypothetical protein